MNSGFFNKMVVMDMKGQAPPILTYNVFAYCLGPSIFSINGRKKSRAQAKAEAGLPGKPSTKPCDAMPNQVGLPGRTAIFSTRNSRPRRAKAGRA